MTKPVIAHAWGLDYVRFRIENKLGLDYVQAHLPYIDVQPRWFHGSQFVDLTGEILETIRMMEDLDKLLLKFAYMFQCKRIDVFIDVQKNWLDQIPTPGTTIANGGNIETVYSHHLKRRGNLPVFARAYDAKAAGHYSDPMTRFEIEFKRPIAGAILNCEGWAVDPVTVAMHHTKDIYGIEIQIPDKRPREFNAPTKRYAHSRERFYARYGKNVLLDFEQMGATQLYTFITNAIEGKADENSNN